MGVVVDQGRIIFIHVIKTGGTSISRALLERFPGAAQRLEGLEGFSTHFRSLPEDRRFGIRGPDHATAANIRDFLGAPIWEKAETFAVVRNPWDLVYSLYSFIRSNRLHRSHQGMQSVSFDDFVASDMTIQWNSQWDLLSDWGQPLVKHILRFEHLGTDYAALAARLGFDGRLDHLNRFPHRDFREAYSPRTRDLVADRFAADLDRFGYTFPT